ncbi:MAG: signal peptidase [Riemerella sp.]|nr:MAG: signal peptidase [Riemerella sp.]
MGLAILFFSVLFTAQPPVPPGGGYGPTGPGAPNEVPIDLYDTALLGVGIVMAAAVLVYYKKRMKIVK